MRAVTDDGRWSAGLVGRQQARNDGRFRRFPITSLDSDMLRAEAARAPEKVEIPHWIC
jgi:hypothetical protein